MTTKILGRYIIADPSICHGEPTFRGTRILVKDVLEQIESKMAWEAIIEEWGGIDKSSDRGCCLSSSHVNYDAHVSVKIRAIRVNRCAS